jgi:hypothetical protein
MLQGLVREVGTKWKRISASLGEVYRVGVESKVDIRVK